MKCKNKLVDDGFCPDFVEGATFDGVFEIPKIPIRENLQIPEYLCPFSKINQEFGFRTYVMFYEYDKNFREIFSNIEETEQELMRFDGVISPDCSLYWDMPLCTQIANTYLNRALGYYLHKKGHNVIPNIRWGDERSYTSCTFKEPFSFQSVQKNSIVAVGNYGCFRSGLEKYHFVRGFKAMLDYLEPSCVLVYGCLPPKIFNQITHETKIYHFENWTKVKHNKKQS